MFQQLSTFYDLLLPLLMCDILASLARTKPQHKRFSDVEVCVVRLDRGRKVDELGNK